MEEIELLRKIADEAKNTWDKGFLSLEAVHLKNLLTDRIDFDDRHNKALHADKEMQCQLINNCPINPVKCMGTRCPQYIPCR